jgi:hypothetical protein
LSAGPSAAHLGSGVVLSMKNSLPLDTFSLGFLLAPAGRLQQPLYPNSQPFAAACCVNTAGPPGGGCWICDLGLWSKGPAEQKEGRSIKTADRAERGGRVGFTLDGTDLTAWIRSEEPERSGGEA